MNTRVLDLPRAGEILVRPLRDGDLDTVLAVLHGAGGTPESRHTRQRFSEDELLELARVDATHHVLVAYGAGEREPIALARLVRQGARAELAVAIVPGRRPPTAITAALAGALVSDARAAGVREVVAVESWR